MIQEYDYLFKLVIIGNTSVGKSSLLIRFSDDQFNESYLTTIGVDFRFRTMNIDGKNVKLQIWDTAGQERFRTITNAYYKGADGIILVYDVTNQASFDDIDKYWLNEVESYAEKDVTLMLIGNKSDLLDDKVVQFEQAEEFGKLKNILVYEASAKTADQVNNAFTDLARTLMAKRNQQQPKLNTKNQQQPTIQNKNQQQRSQYDQENMQKTQLRGKGPNQYQQKSNCC